MALSVIVLCLLMVAIPATLSRFPSIKPPSFLIKTTSIAPLLVAMDAYFTNWGSGWVAYVIGDYTGVLANHVIDMLVLSLVTIFVGRHTQSRFLFWAYFATTFHHFLYVSDYWNNGGEIFYSSRKDVFYVMQTLIIIGLLKDGVSGGKRNATRRNRLHNIPYAYDIGYNGGIRTVQAKAIR